VSGEVVPLPPGVVGLIVAEDVAALAGEFRDYEIGSAWVASASGPDFRYLWARDAGGVLIASPDRAMLARELRARRAIEPPGG
jgi:hypothetical protein